MSTAYDRELAIIEAQYARGEMSLAEYNAAIRDLEREATADAYEQAERAYRDALEGWQ